MKYPLKIGDERMEVEIRTSYDPQRYLVTLNGKTMELFAQTLSENRVQINFEDTAYTVYLADDPAGKHIFINGFFFRVSKLEDRSRVLSRCGHEEESSGEVTPPMPSVVVRILVQEGDWVEKGQGLMVVTAMKMETTLKAPVAGKVLKIRTALQAKVMPGDKLIEIEPEGKESTTN
jgi:3-methylcrotonyl-CoA carboxylase alpha subunit